jgi:hypothetical protein
MGWELVPDWELVLGSAQGPGSEEATGLGLALVQVQEQGPAEAQEFPTVRVLELERALVQGSVLVKVPVQERVQG